MNNDLISRGALKKVIETYRPTPIIGDYLQGKNNMINFCLEEIDNAPTVKAFTEEDMAGAYNEGYACGGRENERPQGKWLFDKENSFTIDIFKCSICGYFGHTHFKFCPNCGADMRKGGAE